MTALLYRAIEGYEFLLMADTDAEGVGEEGGTVGWAGISTYSARPTVLVTRKKGQIWTSIRRDASASACEMGILDDLTIISTTSSRRIVLRRALPGGVSEMEPEDEGVEGEPEKILVHSQQRVQGR